MNVPKLISAGAVTVILGAAIFFFMGKDDQAPIASEGLTQNSCATNADCVLVQDGWCKTVLAIKENQKDAWRTENIRQVEIARQNRQTCELIPEEFQIMENFSAVCEQFKCAAKFTGVLTR